MTDSPPQIQTNAFSRSEPETRQDGIFMHPTLAMVNHSCVPNALVVFSNRKAFLRALRPIATGEEIEISYIGMLSIPSPGKRGES